MKKLYLFLSIIILLLLLIYSFSNISLNANFTKDFRNEGFLKKIILSYFNKQANIEEVNLSPGKHSISLNYDGIERQYILYIPRNYLPGNPAMISFHGGGGNAEQQCKDAKLFESSEKYGHIVVCPDGTTDRRIGKFYTWNDKSLPVYAKENNINDIGFTEKIIEDLLSKYKADPKKIFVSGYSNGGIFAYRLACEIPEKIASVGVVAASIGENKNCSSNLAVPIIAFHGLNDSNILFFGGSGPNALAPYDHPSFQESINYWILKNNASSNPINQKLVGNAQNYEYGSNQTVLISTWILNDGGHTWPGGDSNLGENMIGKINRDISATEEMILFFTNHSR